MPRIIVSGYQPAGPTGLAPIFAPILVVTVASSTSLNVIANYTAPPTGVNYVFQQATNSGGPFSTIATQASGNLVVSGLSTSTTYYFRVAEIVSDGRQTDWSSIQSGTPSGATGTSMPRFGTYFIGGQSAYGSAAYINRAALCDVNVFNAWDGFTNFGGGGTSPATICAAIKAINSNALIAQYAQPWVQANSGTGNAPVQTAAAAANWWLRATYPAGAIKQNEGPSLNNMDVMAGGNTYTSGSPSVARDWLKFLPDWTQDFSQLGNAKGIAVNTNAVNSNITGIYLDDVFWKTQITADYLRTGAAQSAGDATASAQMRAAYATMFARFAANNPGGLILANLSQFPSNGSFPTEYVGLINGGVAEGSQGYSWSDEQSFGTTKAIANMTAMGSGLADPGYYIYTSGNLTVNGADPSAFSGSAPSAFYPNWTGARYGFCMCFAMSVAKTPLYMPLRGASDNSPTYQASTASDLYFDEMGINVATNAPYGSASAQSGIGYLGPRDAIGVKDATSGCYYATFGGGKWCLIINPKGNSASASINILALTGKHFKFFNGTQDPTVNNGTTVSSVVFSNGRDGRVGQLV